MYPVMLEGKKVAEIVPGQEAWLNVKDVAPDRHPRVEVHFGLTIFHCAPTKRGIYHAQFCGTAEAPEFMLNWSGGQEQETIHLTLKETRVTATEVIRTEVYRVYENTAKLAELNQLLPTPEIGNKA